MTSLRPLDAHYLVDRDVSYLDKMLTDSEGKLLLLSSKIYDEIDRQALMLWCHKTARYCIPTIELIEWLSEEIRGRTAIEIGAGRGELGRHLGIPMTDNKMQDNELVRMAYKEMGQPTIPYGKKVEQMEAMEAVQAHQPRVVIGAWVTQYGDASVPKSSPFGVEEVTLISAIEKYIMIGNEREHSTKKALSIPHRVYKPKHWKLVSRSRYPDQDIIYVWGE
jgi:hypothetical protein